MDDTDLVSVLDELPLWSAPFGLKLLDTIRYKPNIRVLDVGCGTGFPLIEIAQRLGSTCTVYGLDPWEQALERIRLKIQTYNLTNVEIVNGVAEHLPFENEYFDLIVSNNGINNVTDLVVSLRECSRVSRPGAQFVLTLNMEDTMMEFYHVYRTVLITSGRKEKVSLLEKQIYSKRKPLIETTAALVDAGFEILSVDHDLFSLRFLDANSFFNHSLIKYWFLEGWKGILDGDDVYEVFDQIGVELDRVAGKEGGIRLSIPFVTIDCRRREGSSIDY